MGREEPAEHQDPAGRQGQTERRGPAEPEDAQARARTRRALAVLRTGNKAKAEQAWADLDAARDDTADLPF
ncbi:hypothetical protein CZ774_09460 [Frigoribacterium sp. JB110]|nr:hypothetical protein CZ774_09460 [Frigoribacterium sp. JB110]